MERFDHHNLAERNKTNNIKHAIMETRTFRIGPAKDDDAIVFLDKNLRGPYPHAGYEFVHDSEIDDNDDLAVAVPNRSLYDDLPMSSHKSRCRSNCNAHRVDARDDDEPSPTVLRAYNHINHHPPRGYRQRQQHQLQHKKAIATVGRTSTETEKRIAQLRNAGLSISTNREAGGLVPPLCSPPRIVIATDKAFRFRSSPRHAEVEREPPPAQGFDDHDVLGDNHHNPKTALRALLEKDSNRRKQRVKERHSSSTAFNGDSNIVRVHQLSGAGGCCSIPKSSPQSPFPRGNINGFATEIVQDENAHNAHDAFCVDVDVDPIIAARPAYQGLRVSQKDYPDPEAFGWEFVGSCPERRVEFFEKDDTNSNNKDNKGIAAVMVLEFHYTTGTVKVTLEHPLRGSSLLDFAHDGIRVLQLEPPADIGTSMGISPKIYRNILLDPQRCNSSSNIKSPSSSSTTPADELVVCFRSVMATQQHHQQSNNNDMHWQHHRNRKKMNNLETRSTK